MLEIYVKGWGFDHTKPVYCMIFCVIEVYIRRWTYGLKLGYFTVFPRMMDLCVTEYCTDSAV